ncbi:MAG TPA: VIT1/CCC1 transporter family protein [Nitrospirales bacterium]|nr:VIT1/CCC1 transporter family protein [Nitrospirales bacterium]
MLKPSDYDRRLARTLILDEVFDLALYRALRGLAHDRLGDLLEQLIAIETQHVAFWQNFFDDHRQTLDVGRRVKLQVIILACRVFGPSMIHLVLEAIEVYGVRKYLAIWKTYRDQPLGEAVRGILIDEMKHEDVIVSQMTERKINPERIRNIFLGLNDGLVEILGAVSGFFGAFGNAGMVLIAGATTAFAGSLSMAAGAYVALSSEREVLSMEADKQRFLGERDGVVAAAVAESALPSAIVVGVSYFMGAMVPLLPVALGAQDALLPVIAAGTIMILVSMLLAFLSGMDILRRILTNLVILAAAVALTYGIGLAAKHLWGIAV